MTSFDGEWVYLSIASDDRQATNVSLPSDSRNANAWSDFCYFYSLSSTFITLPLDPSYPTPLGSTIQSSANFLDGPSNSNILPFLTLSPHYLSLRNRLHHVLSSPRPFRCSSHVVFFPSHYSLLLSLPLRLTYLLRSPGTFFTSSPDTLSLLVRVLTPVVNAYAFVMSRFHGFKLYPRGSQCLMTARERVSV